MQHHKALFGAIASRVSILSEIKKEQDASEHVETTRDVMCPCGHYAEPGSDYCAECNEDARYMTRRQRAGAIYV